jgi:hypothetical protein
VQRPVVPDPDEFNLSVQRQGWSSGWRSETPENLPVAAFVAYLQTAFSSFAALLQFARISHAADLSQLQLRKHPERLCRL